MLLANCSVAAKIQETFPQTAVLRRHGLAPSLPPLHPVGAHRHPCPDTLALPFLSEPPKTNFENLDDLLFKTKGMHLDASSSGALARSLDTCVDPAEPAFNTLVRILATRCMLSAEYFCAGSVSRDAFLHYGLAAPIYTRQSSPALLARVARRVRALTSSSCPPPDFTSPIRRYADVLAHRQLSAAIGYTALHSSLSNKAHVERIMSNVNKRHRMAQQAGRASVEFYVGLALKGRSQKDGETVEVREEAFVIRCFKNGVAVYVHKCVPRLPCPVLRCAPRSWLTPACSLSPQARHRGPHHVRQGPALVRPGGLRHHAPGVGLVHRQAGDARRVRQGRRQRLGREGQEHAAEQGPDGARRAHQLEGPVICMHPSIASSVCAVGVG